MKNKAYLTREIIEKINKSAGISFKTVNKESFEKIRSKALLLNLVQYSDNDFLVINTYDSIKGEQLVVYSYKEICLGELKIVLGGMSHFQKTDFTSIDLHNVNTSEIRIAVAMFEDCKAKNIDVSTIDTSNMVTMGYMFRGVQLSTTLDLSNFKTNKLIDMIGMFEGAKLKELKLDKFDTSNVIDMHEMFRDAKISNLDLSMFNTENVKEMDSMFRNADIEYIDMSNFKISSNTSTAHMFEGCKAYINRGEDT